MRLEVLFMVAERSEDIISASESVSQMAHYIRWFTNELGSDVVGNSVYEQVNSPNSYAARLLEEAAFGRRELEEGVFPPLYNLPANGSAALLRKLGFMQNGGGYISIIVPQGDLRKQGTHLELIHPNQPFVAKLKVLSDSELTGLENVLSIKYDPDWQKPPAVIRRKQHL